MNECKALLIDCNGTLVDSYDAETNLMIEVANRHNSHGGMPLTAGDFNTYGGRKITELFTGVMRKTGVENFEQAGLAASSEFFARYDEILDKMTLINPCTNAVATGLRSYGIKTAIVSSAEKPLLEKVSKHFGFYDNFDLVIGRDGEEGEKSSVYLKALSGLGVEPEEAMAVEDAPRGIAAARAAGVGLIVGIRNTHSYDELKEAGADEVIERLNELLILL